MITVHRGANAFGAIHTGFGFLEIAGGFVDSSEIDEGLGEVGGIHLAFIQVLPDGQRPFMHGLCTIHIHAAVVENAEIVVHGGDSGALLTIKTLEGFERLAVISLRLVEVAELLEDHREVVFDRGHLVGVSKAVIGADVEGQFVKFRRLVHSTPAIIQMRKQGIDSGEQIGVLSAQFLGAEQRLTIKRFRLAKISLLLAQIGENADLLHQSADTDRIVVRKPPRLLDTAGGGGNLALQGGIHVGLEVGRRDPEPSCRLSPG